MDRMCRVCLAEDRKTFVIANTALEQAYDVVTGVKLQRAGRPTALCCVCVSQLRRCRRFIETAKESNDALDRWYQNHTHTDWKFTERPLISFNNTPTECIDIWYPHFKSEQSTDTDDTGKFIKDEKHAITFDDVPSDPLQLPFKLTDNKHLVQKSDDEQDNTQASDDELDNTQMPVDKHDNTQTSDDELDNTQMPVDKHDNTQTYDDEQDSTQTSDVELVNTSTSDDELDNTSTSDDELDNTSTSDDELDNTSTSGEENVRATKCSNVERNNSDVFKNLRSETDSGISNVKANRAASDLNMASTSFKSRKQINTDKDVNAYKANLKEDDRAEIVALHKAGHNITQISNETGFSREAVRRWVRRYEAGGNLESRMRPGRPPLLNPSLLRYMLTEYEKNGYVTPREYAEVFYTSPQTIRRALHGEGLRTKQFRLQQHKDERLRFSREYLDFNWETTVFCDEKTLRFSQKEGIRLYSVNSTSKRTFGKITLNLWGWMSAQGPGELVFINNRADSEQYIEILSDTMLPTVRTIYPEDDLPKISFVHDNNCPISRSQSVQHWFSKQSNIKIIPWPPRSPDLNPLESIWDIMVQRWEALGEMSPEQVKSHCLQLWDSLRGTDVCANSVASIRQRLQRCIDNNGGHI